MTFNMYKINKIMAMVALFMSTVDLFMGKIDWAILFLIWYKINLDDARQEKLEEST